MKIIILFFIFNLFDSNASPQFKPLVTSVFDKVIRDAENKLFLPINKDNNDIQEISMTLSPDNPNDLAGNLAETLINDEETIPSMQNTSLAVQNPADTQVIIIGAGPSGCAAATYLSRSNFKTVVINGQSSNSQLIWADKIENFLGLPDANGVNLLNQFQEQAKSAGAKFLNADVVEIDFSNRPYKIHLSDGKILSSDYILIATGSKPKDLNVPGEHEYRGKGIGVCAHCDGPLCENKETVIIGGNYDMLRELNILAKHTNKITIITKESDFKNIPSYFTRNLCKTVKPKILFNHVVQ
jgi:alkyl hydroperoxide reductase subunit AhpF